MNELQVFKNSEFGELGVLEIEGKPYFPATACAKILGYKEPKSAIRLHCRWGVKHTLPHPQNSSKEIVMNFIPEGDLYRLIVSSKLPAAEKFERWVFDEVLPTIRKQGGYVQNMQEVIAQTATVVATEVLRQLIPDLKGGLKSTCVCEEADEREKRPRKKAPGIIDRLDIELRQDVEHMLCTGQYTYSDIVAYLADYGVELSVMAVHRFSKRLFKV
ncbi:MAG: BRO family protein [Hydrogenoanaerobacterium sp.]